MGWRGSTSSGVVLRSLHIAFLCRIPKCIRVGQDIGEYRVYTYIYIYIYMYKDLGWRIIGIFGTKEESE